MKFILYFHQLSIFLDSSELYPILINKQLSRIGGRVDRSGQPPSYRLHQCQYPGSRARFRRDFAVVFGVAKLLIISTWESGSSRC